MTRKALKEWALAIKALETGEQILLLRKGGLVEGGGRFNLEAERFFLYPTRYHQEPNVVKPGYEHLVEAAASEEPAKGRLRIHLIADAVETVPVTDREAVQAVDSHYIWSTHYMENRFDWKPESPLFLLLLRVSTLRQAQEIPLLPSYAGCTSWVDLEEDIQIDGAEPVLDDETFRARVEAVHDVLGVKGL